MGISTREKYIKHGSVLAVTSLLVRIIGMVYRIPMTAIIGDRGNGLYSAAFEIYNILLLVSTYTLPMAISKLVSPILAQRDFKAVIKFYRLALIFALIVGCGLFALTFFGADFLSGMVLKSPASAIALRVLAPTILVVSVMGVLRGMFQSTGSMVQTSISQIIEQIVNAVVSVVAAYMLFNLGTKIYLSTLDEDIAYALGAAGGTTGTLTGAVVALFYLSIAGIVFSSEIKRMSKRQINTYANSYHNMLKNLMFTIFPIILSTAVYNFNTILCQGIYYHTSAANGFIASEYESMWGIFSGKYKLLSNVPIAIASSMATSVIPALSVSVAQKENSRIINKKLKSTVKTVMVVTLPCVIGLTVLSHPIINLIFNGSQASQKMAGDMLLYGSIVVLFTALSTLSTGFLQGIGMMKAPVINSFIALVLQLITFKLMLDYTELGIFGMIVSNIIFMIIVSVLNSLVLRRKLGYRQDLGRSFILPTIASILMGGICFAMYKLSMLIIHSNAISTVIAILVSIPVYFVLIIKLRVVNESEMINLPKGRALVRIAYKLRLW